MVSTKVRNHTLLKKDFKSGQLAAGKREVTAPQGVAGAPGAIGPQGLADSARTY